MDWYCNLYHGEHRVIALPMLIFFSPMLDASIPSQISKDSMFNFLLSRSQLWGILFPIINLPPGTWSRPDCSHTRLICYKDNLHWQQSATRLCGKVDLYLAVLSLPLISILQLNVLGASGLHHNPALQHVAGALSKEQGLWLFQPQMAVLYAQGTTLILLSAALLVALVSNLSFCHYFS